MIMNNAPKQITHTTYAAAMADLRDRKVAFARWSAGDKWDLSPNDRAAIAAAVDSMVPLAVQRDEAGHLMSMSLFATVDLRDENEKLRELLRRCLPELRDGQQLQIDILEMGIK